MKGETYFETITEKELSVKIAVKVHQMNKLILRFYVHYYLTVNPRGDERLFSHDWKSKENRLNKLPEIHVLSTRKKIKQGAHSAQYLVSVETQVIYTGNTL